VEVKTLIVHKFQVGDVDDPDIYAAGPIFDWACSEAGKWVMAHAVEQPEWRRHATISMYGYEYVIVARLIAKDYTYWILKWGSND
jgi:hypothetical protein